MKHLFVTHLMIAVLLLAGGSPRAEEADFDPSGPSQPLVPAEGSPVVKKLKALVARDKKLRRALEDAIGGVEKGGYWQGKTLREFYFFMDEWRVFTASATDARLYYDRFMELLDEKDRSHKDLIHEVNEGAFGEWLKEFMQARKAYLDSPASADAVKYWVSRPGIQIEEFRVPPGGFKSFNQFFSRELKPGARAIYAHTDPSAIISPADCDLRQSDVYLATGGEIEVKGETINVSKLLGDDEYGKSFLEGVAIVCALYENNYHRFHAPIDGKVVSSGLIGGPYFEDISNIKLLTRNHRGYVVIDTEQYGHVGVVPVGIATISSVNISVENGQQVVKGDELGYFEYGGSLVLLLFEKDQFTPRSLLKMGEHIGNLSNDRKDVSVHDMAKDAAAEQMH